MNKRMKRAFTITELVIVIAVVAILAAVLIPTFAGVIDKANMSVDQQAVRDMNLALVNANIDGSVEVLSDALEVLEEAGMDAKNYKALASGYDFVWVKSINRVLYVEKETNKVVYPEEYVHMTYLPTNETWMTLEGAIKGDDSWETTVITTADLAGTASAKYGVVKNGDEITAVKVDTAPRLVSVVEYLNDDKNKNKSVDLYLGADIDLQGAEWQPIRTMNGNFEGNNFKITNLQMSNPTTASDTVVGGSSNVYTFYGFVGIFKGTSFKNVTIDADIQTPGVSGGFVGSSDYNKKPFGNHTVAGAIGGIVKETDSSAENDVVVENVTVNGTIVGHSRVGGVIGYIGGHPESGKQAVGKVTLRNLTNNATVMSENYTKSDFSTAGGIMSIVIQTTAQFGLEFDNCVNNGEVTAMHSAGMVAYVSTNGSIYMHECTNSGLITTNFNGVENLKDTYSTMHPSASGLIGILQGVDNFSSTNTFGEKTVYGILIEDCAYTGTVQVYAGGDSSKAMLEQRCTLDNSLAGGRKAGTYKATNTN